MSSYGSVSDGEGCAPPQGAAEPYYEPPYYPLYQTMEHQHNDVPHMEEGYWGSPCSSGSPSGRGGSPMDPAIDHSPQEAHYQYTTLHYPYDKAGGYDEGYYGGPQIPYDTLGGTVQVPFVRVVKKRCTANKKERRRTLSINTAFSDLRNKIPNVPADTKLSKIKTLRLATSYIKYLMGALKSDGEPAGGFRAELVSAGGRRSTQESRRNHHHTTGHSHEGGSTSQGQSTHYTNSVITCKAEAQSSDSDSRRSKGRTGWPQHVWALELKHEPTL